MNIRFGVELETKAPRTCGLAVGGYHVGYPVRTARATNGQELAAPTFNGATWRADRDGSITCEPGEMPCEFVSPILYGAEGVESLCRFMEWMSAIGATVDNSCGVHITWALSRCRQPGGGGESLSQPAYARGATPTARRALGSRAATPHARREVERTWQDVTQAGGQETAAGGCGA